MKRIVAGGLSVALGFGAFTHAEEVEWHAIGVRKPVAKLQRPEVVPVNAVRGGPKEAAMLPLPSASDPSAIAVPIEANPFPDTIAMPAEPPPAAKPSEPAPSLKPSGPAPATSPSGPPLPIVELNRKPTPYLANTVPSHAAPMTSDDFVGPIMPGGAGCACDCGPASPMPYVLPECTSCNSSGVAVGGNRFFVRGEALLWWTRGLGGPALATTGSAASMGIIGRAGVNTVLNFDDLNTQFRPGVRVRAGWWFDPCQTRGIDASAFWTPTRTGQYTATDAEFVRLFRPFFALNTGIVPINNRPGEFTELVFDRPNVFGRFEADLRSVFWGADVNYRRSIWMGCNGQADVFAGFRYLNLDEKLTITENIRPQVAVGFGNFTLPAGSRLDIRDRFTTRNDFYGVQFGGNIELTRNRWVFDIRPVVALGTTQQKLTIDGSQTVSPAAAAPPGVFTGGLLALNSNIGSYERNPFTVVPEVTFNVGYNVNDHWKLFAGYNFLYWSNVIRPGDQIDRNIDVTRVPNFVPANVVVPAVPGNHPGVPFNQTDFWAQGANVGVEYKW